MFVAMSILVAKIVPQEAWLYLTIKVNLLAKSTNKFLMFVAMSILVAKIVPQETWLYLTIKVNLSAKSTNKFLMFVVLCPKPVALTHN